MSQEELTQEGYQPKDTVQKGYQPKEAPSQEPQPHAGYQPEIGQVGAPTPTPPKDE